MNIIELLRKFARQEKEIKELADKDLGNLEDAMDSYGLWGQFYEWLKVEKLYFSHY